MRTPTAARRTSPGQWRRCHRSGRLAVTTVAVLLCSCGENGGTPAGPTEPVVTSVEITPSNVTLDALGQGVELAAVARDAAGRVVTRTFTWASSNTAVATVVSDGMVTAIGNGSTTISATSGGVQGTCAVTVAQQVASIEIDPDIYALTDPGDTVRFTAVAEDWLGNPVTGTSFSWASSDAAVLTVTSSGLATAVSNGSVMITVVTDGYTDSAGVAVGPLYWQAMGLAGIRVWSLLIDRSSDHVFAGTASGLYRSTDEGQTWMQVTSLPGNDVWSLVINGDGDIFANAEDGAFRSTDGSSSWTVVSSSLDGSLRQLAIGPSGDIFVGTSQGLFRSSDKGDSWTATGYDGDVDRVAVNDSGYIYVGTELNGMFRSTDEGVSWTQMDFGAGSDGEILSIAIDSASGELFTCCPGGVFRSTDDGDTWIDVTNGQVHPVLAFAFDANEDIFAGTCEGGVLRSADRGGTWTPVNAGLPGLITVGMAFNSGGLLFAGMYEGGVFRRADPPPSTVGPNSPRFCWFD